MKSKPYIRKKNDRYIIEQVVKGKTKYLAIVPRPDKLLAILRHIKDNPIPSKPTRKQKQKPVQKFGESSLNEVLNTEERLRKTLPRKIITPEEINKLWEMTK